MQQRKLHNDEEPTRKSELQVLSFIFRPLCKFCPLCLKLTSFVLYVKKSSTFYPLGKTCLIFKDKTCLIF
ncbi:hypothetical protein Hanom_Chr12g01084071 [Helianthus anomalus]